VRRRPVAAQPRQGDHADRQPDAHWARPERDPIELVFGTPKAALRRAGARTREALEAAIREALAAVTPEQIRAFFAHCGYPLQGLALRQGR
jgi:hypothetical protein